MAISYKGKRRLIYKGNLYLWKYAKNAITVISKDKKLHLYYKTYQCLEQFVNPKITVLISDKLEKGTYIFLPRIWDEIYSSGLIRGILDWYEKKDNTEKPIRIEKWKNSFESIDFRSGVITNVVNDFSLSNSQKDLLQVSYHDNYILNVSWDASENKFLIIVVKDDDWENPKVKQMKYSFYLHETVKNIIVFIEEIIN